MYREERSQNEIFAENLRKLMRDKNVSQNGLARILGCTPTAVNSWCNAQVTPRPDKIEAIARYFNVSREELLRDKTAIPNLSIPAAYPVPILGRICAGDGIDEIADFDGYFFVDQSIKADYCLRVEGDSMKDAHIYHGDIAFLRKAYDFLNGGIYAVVFGEDRNAVLKRVYRQGESILLMPCNQAYDPITVTSDFQIVGELVGVYSPRSN